VPINLSNFGNFPFIFGGEILKRPAKNGTNAKTTLRGFFCFFFKKGPSRSSKNGSNNDDAILQGFQVSKEVLDCENKFEKMGYRSTKK
jgi:hypothetical protein